MRGYTAIGLYSPKFNVNVGGAMRAAACYEASLIVIAPRRKVKYITDTTKIWRHTPTLVTKDLFSVIPYNCVPVAIEFIEDSKSLINYVHPERAYYIFGPEDGTLGKEYRKKCRDTVYIPTKYCMNLAATVNVVLYDRLTKERRC